MGKTQNPIDMGPRTFGASSNPSNNNHLVSMYVSRAIDETRGEPSTKRSHARIAIPPRRERGRSARGAARRAPRVIQPDLSPDDSKLVFASTNSAIDGCVISPYGDASAGRQ
jgi:hypothetical protein